MPETTKSEEDYRAEMYETFTKLGTKPEEWRWNGANPEEIRGYGGVPAGACQLCGKHPIAYEYTLVHVGGSMQLRVGSECVTNFIDAAPYSEKRRAREAEKKFMLYNKMANYLVKKDGRSYEEAREMADKMTEYSITRLFAGVARQRNAKRLAARAAAVKTLMRENYERLRDQNWDYYGRRTILTSLDYMRRSWESGRETPYMEAPMNAALAELGLQLPAKPKAKDLEK